MSPEAEGPPALVSLPSVDSSPGTKLLPTVLSVIAGSADVTSFLGLGVFNAHITGNLVILAAHLVTGRAANLTLFLSVPVFIVVVGLTRLLADALEAIGLASLRPLLLLQFLLFAGLLAVCIAAGPRIDPNAANAVLAGLLGVSAMAVQNALVQISLKGSPTTAVMTTNVTHFATDIGEVLLGRDPADAVRARHRATHTWPVIVGFTAGAGLGAACFAACGVWSMALPATLSLLALAIGPAARLDRGQH